ncbi:PIN2/TERF1-interacting telomerase inhibitor 1 [Vanessa cardui]|uniref:PIN2/TERF1-interacting telomerase inhibitor 1 n=1 Tax=Vanessa cardui TaxID=171605 RepID=UPI001F137E67|nr:PIN2/TERF1-interacting telomerase inhibitor 1 [Vanessa cardui]
MSMLAAPRRKQKVINLRAKNNAWSNDTNKFGQKMLEKMGWSAGKGLGAKENGMVDHVVAKYKNDERGLGFEDKNDQWTKHEDDFNALLANLSNAENNTEILHSGVSLEDKSKKSKARIHYHKFTRGKDMSRYSEKDLANIFGKKSLKEKEEEKLVQDDVKTSEQVFTEKGNMDDYFKNKLASLKSKGKLLNSKYQSNNEEVVADYSFKGFSNDTETDNETTNTSAYQGFSFYNMNNKDNVETTSSHTIIDNHEELVKKKKKSKKKEQSEVTEEHCSNEDLGLNNELQPDTLQETKVKKSKKKKYQELTEDSFENEPIKKKKKDKNKLNEEIHEQIATCNEDEIPKKKKKRKHQNND